MCLFFSILFLGPRFGLIMYRLGWPARWELVFDGWFWPLVGFLIAPWTTLMWVVCAPGGITGIDYVAVGLAGLADVATMLSSGRGYAVQRG
jgi:hypothetical protein